MSVHTIPKPPHGSAEWLAVRWADEHGLRRIPASASAAIHGEHRFIEPADLAAEQLAPEPPQPKRGNKAMERGTALEPALRSWLSDQLGIRMDEPDVLYVAGRLIATADAIAGPVNQPDVWGECKTSNEPWTGTLPRGWYWQGVQQAICGDLSEIHWAILDGNLELHHHIQTVEDWEKQHHTQKCEEWLAAIDMGFAPVWVSFDVSHVAQIHPDPEPVTVALPEQARMYLSDLAAAKRMASTAKQQENAAKAALANMLGPAEQGELDGQIVVTFKQFERAGYAVEPSSGRRLVVKGLK